MTINAEQLKSLQYIENIDAAAAYSDSDVVAENDGYMDALAHEFDIMRGANDDAYFRGYQSGVEAEAIMRDLGWLEDADSYENQPGYVGVTGSY